MHKIGNLLKYILVKTCKNRATFDKKLLQKWIGAIYTVLPISVLICVDRSGANCGFATSNTTRTIKRAAFTSSCWLTKSYMTCKYSSRLTLVLPTVHSSRRPIRGCVWFIPVEHFLLRFFAFQRLLSASSLRHVCILYANNVSSHHPCWHFVGCIGVARIFAAGGGHSVST